MVDNNGRFRLVGNTELAQSTRIPAAQVGTFKCNVCADSVFKLVPVLSFHFDKLNPTGGMSPRQGVLYQCVKCNGYLKKNIDGSYIVVQFSGDMEVS
jgi:hypothetical protein